MSDRKTISDLKVIKDIADSEDASPTTVMIAQMLVIVRDFINSLPDDKRLDLSSATVEQIWKMAKP